MISVTSLILSNISFECFKNSSPASVKNRVLLSLSISLTPSSSSSFLIDTVIEG